MASAEDKRPLREIIREEATRLFANRGFSGTSIRDVARASSCANAALYYHYASKEELFRLVIEHHLNRVLKLLSTSMHQTGTVRERLTRLAGDVINECATHPMGMRLCMHAEGTADSDVRTSSVDALRMAFLERIASVIEQGIASGELKEGLAPMDGALVFVGAVYLQCEMTISSGRRTRDRHIRIMDLLMQGIVR